MTEAELFETGCIPEPNSGCWLWEGAADKNGYGCVKALPRHRRDRRAHRVSWAIYRGDIPSGLCVLHKCDTPACVNPDHLFLGTQSDNNADMTRKGRHRGWGNGQPLLAGASHPLAKLTETLIQEIRSDTRGKTIITKDHGISRSLVYRIKKRKTWKHI